VKQGSPALPSYLADSMTGLRLTGTHPEIEKKLKRLEEKNK
jgi:hypothetical protein